MPSPSLQEESRYSKKRRLNYACDRCRSRKVRCDDRRPDCTNCFKAGAPCVTRDRRNPSALVVRHEAQAQLQSSSQERRASSHSNIHHTSTPVVDANVTTLLSQRPSPVETENDAQPPGQGIAAARLPIFPRFVNGNSLYILTQWLDLAFARLNHSFRFSHLCREAKGHVVQDPTSDGDPNKILSDSRIVDAILAKFLYSVHHIFPIFSAEYWEDLLNETNSNLSRSILRALVVAISCGPTSRENLNTAFSQLGFLVQTTNLESLVAFVLMVIAFRGHDDSETAVRVLSLANSVASMMGLQRTSPSHTTDHIHVWWTLFTLDKILAIELERPAVIRSQDCTQKEVTDHPLLNQLILFARVQERIVETTFQQRGEEESSESTLEEIILHKLKTASELDAMLLDWQARLPPDIQVTDHLLCHTEDMPGISLLALQYHQTLMSVHRNGLITNTKHIRHLADTVFEGSRFRLRLWNTSLLCYSTAKFIVTLLGQLRDNQCESILNTTYSPLIAAIVLAIYIYKYPTATIVKVDLELFTLAIDFVERRSTSNTSVDQAGTLSKLLRSLLTDLADRVKRTGPSHANRIVPSINEKLLDQQVQTNGQSTELGNNDISNQANTNHASQDLWIEVQAQTDHTIPFLDTFDSEWSASDVANWPEFLQMLDLTDQNWMNN